MYSIVLRAILAMSLLSPLGCGGGGKGPALEFANPWARSRTVDPGDEVSGSGANSAVYLEIRNRGRIADRLQGGETAVASRTEIHQTFVEGDVARMRRLPSQELPAGQTVSLAPGGVHLMLLDLRVSLLEGDTVDLTLTFERSPPVHLRVPVRGVEGD